MRCGYVSQRMKFDCGLYKQTDTINERRICLAIALGLSKLKTN